MYRDEVEKLIKELKMKGSAMIAAFILIVIGSLIVGGFLIYVSHESNMTDRLNDSIKALYIAEAGLERALGNTYQEWLDDPDELPEPENISETELYFSDDTYGTYETEESWITADISKNIESTGTYQGETRIVSMDVSIVPESFGGFYSGSDPLAGRINANVRLMGSLYITGEEPFIDTNENDLYDSGEPFDDLNGNGNWGNYLDIDDHALEMGGNADIGNNYIDMPESLKNELPSIVNEDGIETLDAELKVKFGEVQLQGSAATVGSPEVIEDPPAKNTMDSVNVQDGFDGSGGIDNVYTDELLADRSQINDKVRVPNINDAYGSYSSDPTLPYDDETVRGYEAYLLDEGLDLFTTYGITDLTIDPTLPDFVYGDVTTPGANGISKDGASLQVNGLVYIPGSLTIEGQGQNNTINYSGRGTLYVRGSRDGVNDNDVNISINILTSSFPNNNILGIMSRENIYFTGADRSVMGVFYAGRSIICTRQYEIAGTFISNYYNMGSNTPHLYEVPAVSELGNRPPYMDIFYFNELSYTNWHEVFEE